MPVQITQRRWFAADACRMAGTTVTQMRNWRARRESWTHRGAGLFDRPDEERWQRFNLTQIACLGVLSEQARCGISLEIAAVLLSAAGQSVVFWALAHETNQQVATPSSGPENGSWAENVRWLIAVQPVRDERSFFFSHATDPDFFPEWVRNRQPASYAIVDLKRIGQRIAENAPEKSADGVPGSIADFTIVTPEG